MPLAEKVFEICEEHMDTLATRISYELKRACPKRTGEAASSVRIEKIDRTHIFVGSDNLHFYFADQGNGTAGIPKGEPKKRVMPISGSRGQMIAFRTGPFKNYEGKHFVKEVADRHR